MERRDLGHRLVAQRVEAQALGGAAVEQGGKRRRALLVVAKDADHERSVLGLAGERGGGLEDGRRRLVGVVEDEERRSVARASLGHGRQGGLGGLAAAGVEDGGARALNVGGELCDEPRLADPRGAPDHHADDPALARPLPALAQPAKLVLAAGEQGEPPSSWTGSSTIEGGASRLGSWARICSWSRRNSGPGSTPICSISVSRTSR